jgi:hypothetical protein
MADRLRRQQERFTAHLRDPENAPPPDDVEERRMAIYRDLFFRNISSFIAKSFPVLRKLYDDEAWTALMRDFYATHRFHTPLFPEIPREFLQYLQEGRPDRAGDPPFLLELAHYEWVEIALDLDEQELDAVDADPDGDLLTDIPVLSPLAWPLAYRFPVHEIRPGYQPEAAPDEPTHLLVYRDREDRVKFMRMNALTARVVTSLKEDADQSGLDVLKAVAEAMNHPRPEAVVEAGAGLLEDLARRDVILGTKRQRQP